jgi:hypothetical protein
VPTGTVSEAVPVTGLTAIFSPMPRIAPPPVGSEIVGNELPVGVEVDGWPVRSAPALTASRLEFGPVGWGSAMESTRPRRDSPVLSNCYSNRGRSGGAVRFGSWRPGGPWLAAASNSR